MERIKRMTGWDGVPFWRDGRGREFRRVAGGLAWPWDELPGWLVVLGEERLTRAGDGGDGRRHIDVLHAWEGRHRGAMLAPIDLMDEARALSTSLACSVWASPTDLPDAALVPLYNRDLARRDRKLVLRTPPRYERGTAFLFYDRLLERRTRSEALFHAGAEGRALVDEYAVIRPADRLRPVEEFPAVAALLYALAWLDLTPGGGHTRTGAYVAPTLAGY